MPVYLVSPGDRLIRANTFSQAINYAAKASMQATPLRADDVLDRIQKGAKIEDARKPENQELPLENGGIRPKPAAAVDSAPAAALFNGTSSEDGAIADTGERRFPTDPLEPDPHPDVRTLQGTPTLTAAGRAALAAASDIDTVEIDHVR